MVASSWRAAAVIAALGRVGLYAAAAALVIAVFGISVGPRFLPYQTFVVLSASMAPEIGVGSVVVAMPVERSDLRIGDVITYQRVEEPDLPVTHRIVAMRAVPGAVLARTKGDANEVADPWEVNLGASVLRVALAVPFIGYGLYFAQTPVGRILTIGLPLTAIAAIGLHGYVSARRPRNVEPTTTAAAA